MTEQDKQELQEYIKNNVRLHDIRVGIVYDTISRMRCSLQQADQHLYDEIHDAASDWCADNDITSPEYISDTHSYIDEELYP